MSERCKTAGMSRSVVANQLIRLLDGEGSAKVLGTEQNLVGRLENVEVARFVQFG
jgi:hypothetical protein